jgi:hypothetical protein
MTRAASIATSNPDVAEAIQATVAACEETLISIIAMLPLIPSPNPLWSFYLGQRLDITFIPTIFSNTIDFNYNILIHFNDILKLF